MNRPAWMNQVAGLAADCRLAVGPAFAALTTGALWLLMLATDAALIAAALGLLFAARGCAYVG